MTKQESLTLCLAMYAIFSKIRKQGLMSIEYDIECPQESDIIKTIPADVQPLVCDVLRLMVGGNLDAADIQMYIDNMISNTSWTKNTEPLKFVGLALSSSCKGYSPLIAVEFARSTLPQKTRPSFQEVEDFIKEHRYDFDKKKQDDSFEGRVAYVMKLLGKV